MIKHILRLLSGVVFLSIIGFLVEGCRSGYDVEVSGPDLTWDTINASLPVLAAALPKHPEARTFRVKWRIVPDPNRPLESLPHSYIYDRQAKTLAFHHSMPYYDLYSGATDSIIQSVAARKGGARWLLKAGCTRSFPPES